MAKQILAVSSRPSNPVSRLAYLIHAVLEERSAHSVNFSTDYKQQLCVLAGLSFTVVLAEGSKIKSFRPHLATFLRYNKLTHPNKFKPLSIALAEMIRNAIHPFKVLGFPHYYDDFLLAMSRAVSPSNRVSVKTKKVIQGILHELLMKCD